MERKMNDRERRIREEFQGMKDRISGRIPTEGELSDSNYSFGYNSSDSFKEKLDFSKTRKYNQNN